eukprot:maker-scaffold_10-snap-gene-9.3-mRNA-1 protein AED:0.24 eAED:0.24 QI:63/1/1/1/1/1/2/299/328
MASPYRRRPLRQKETLIGRTPKDSAEYLGSIEFAMSSMQGWRITQEDAHVHELPIKARDDLAYFGVFDGHGGSKASSYVAKHILSHIESCQTFKFLNPKTNPDAQILARSLMEGYFNCDKGLSQSPPFVLGDTSGATGVSVLVSPRNFIIANTGDSRIVLSRNDTIQFASKDHKPEDPEEVQRVTAAGGFLKDGRINGDLASARSFGDFRYKKKENLPASQQQVTVMPDIVLIDRDRDNDQILVLACDGIWDVMTNLEAVQFVLAALRLGGSLAQAAELILEECLRKSSGDNMSVVLVALDKVPIQMGTRQGELGLDEVRREMYRNCL